MIRMTLSEYLRKPKDYRGEWTTQRWDIPYWAEVREKYMGKRTLITNIDGATCLVVEGMNLEIIDDSKWKKPDAVKKEISRQCLKFFSERAIEPHYADCLIRWKNNYDTVEARIAIGMDSDTEKDDDIFFYCDKLEDLKSLAENSSEDFYIADCYDFGVYEDLL